MVIFDLEWKKTTLQFLNSVEDFKAKNKNNPIIKHHNLNYSGDIPIWALVELLSFGSTSKLYTMLTTKDKKRLYVMHMQILDITN